jgi:hypothetical protein
LTLLGRAREETPALLELLVAHGAPQQVGFAQRVTCVAGF